VGYLVKQSDFLRWLSNQGASFKDGAKHIKVYCNGKQSVLPRHPSKELKLGLVMAVKKQLGLK
jgi:mRNA interferase HicA